MKALSYSKMLENLSLYFVQEWTEIDFEESNWNLFNTHNKLKNINIHGLTQFGEATSHGQKFIKDCANLCDQLKINLNLQDLISISHIKKSNETTIELKGELKSLNNNYGLMPYVGTEFSHFDCANIEKVELIDGRWFDTTINAEIPFQGLRNDIGWQNLRILRIEAPFCFASYFLKNAFFDFKNTERKQNLEELIIFDRGNFVFVHLFWHF